MKVTLPRIYLSGFRAVLKEHKDEHYDYELKWIDRSGVKYRCMNFAYVCKGAFYYQPKIEMMYKACIEKNVGIFMDSSAFSFFMFIMKGSGKRSNAKQTLTDKEFNRLRDKTIEQYVEFVNKDSKHWDFYANFDYLKNCEIIWEMQKKLEGMGLSPSPVYHGDASIDYFKRYCDKGYKIICIGGYPQSRRGHLPKRRFYERLFKISEEYKVKMQGFAFTNIATMLDFPWWSVDSSTWAKTAAYGMILVPDNDRNVMRSIHVSERHSNNSASYNRMPKSIRKEIEDLVDKAGFDFDKLRTSVYERCTYNAYVYSHLEDYVTLDSVKAEWEDMLV